MYPVQFSTLKVTNIKNTKQNSSSTLKVTITYVKDYYCCSSRRNPLTIDYKFQNRVVA